MRLSAGASGYPSTTGTLKTAGLLSSPLRHDTNTDVREAGTTRYQASANYLENHRLPQVTRFVSDALVPDSFPR